MPIVKRYPNRKLYDTASKRYITLEGIAKLIRQGQEVQVVDHVTGDDLTALTLSQIIFEQEKKRGDFVPRSVLTGLIQAGGETLGSLQRALAAPLGFLHQVDQEIEGRLQDLIRRGEMEEEEARRLLNKLVDQGRRLYAQLGDKELEHRLVGRGVPTREDFQKLEAQIDRLAAKIEALSDKG